METKIKVTERGYPGHFICGYRCVFHRNTLLELNEKRIVVSTVGRLLPFDLRELNKDDFRFESLGWHRYYETMAFKAIYKEPYFEADTSKPISFKSPWSIKECDYTTDYQADIMHENVVKELSERLLKNNKKRLKNKGLNMTTEQELKQIDRINKKKEYCREYYKKNKKRLREYKRQYYQRNKEKIKEREKEYKKNNKEKLQEYYKQRYQQKKQGN